MKRHQVDDGSWVMGGEPKWKWIWFIPDQLGRLFRVHPENPELLMYAGSLSGADASEWRTEQAILSDVKWWNPKADYPRKSDND